MQKDIEDLKVKEESSEGEENLNQSKKHKINNEKNNEMKKKGG